MSNKLPVSTGWSWLKQGFALYRKQPGLLSMLLFMQLTSLVALSALVPLLGVIAAILLVPSFTMARMEACRLIDQNQQVTPSVLFTGFRKGVLGPLCKLGAVYLVVILMVLVLTMLFLSADFWNQVAQVSVTKKLPVFSPADNMTLFIASLAYNAAMLLLTFAPALIYWKQMPPLKATFYSVFAVLGSVRAFAGLLLSWFGIYMLVMTALSALPQTQIVHSLSLFTLFLFALFRRLALYASYKQLFPEPEVKPAPVEVAPTDTEAN
jgi:hypothetical protein